VDAGGCGERGFDALGVEVVIVAVDRGAIEVGFRGGRDTGSDVLGVAGDDASRGEADEGVGAITVYDREERVVREGS
jgi:hypothetical protein